MTTLNFPENLEMTHVLRAFGQGSWPASGEIVTASLAPPLHAEPVALVAVAAWAMHLYFRRGRIRISDSVKSLYTLNTGLLPALANQLPWSDDVQPTGDFFLSAE